jgi:hypothetical protein
VGDGGGKAEKVEAAVGGGVGLLLDVYRQSGVGLLCLSYKGRTVQEQTFGDTSVTDASSIVHGIIYASYCCR